MRANIHVTDYPTDYAPSEQLNELLIKALDVGMAQEEKSGEVVPMLIVDQGGEFDLIAFPNVDFDTARQLTANKLSENPECDAYVLFASASLSGPDFQEDIDAFVAEGAERGMEFGYRLLGIPEDGSIVPLYNGHSTQYLC